MSNSIGAIGVAAHECGHAVQYATGYTPIRIRNGIFPVVSICSKLSMPIILLGFILTAFGGMAPLIVDIGIILYSATVVFQLITLPVEFNASSRALKTLESYRPITWASLMNLTAATTISGSCLLLLYGTQKSISTIESVSSGS